MKLLVLPSALTIVALCVPADITPEVIVTVEQVEKSDVGRVESAWLDSDTRVPSKKSCTALEPSTAARRLTVTCVPAWGGSISLCQRGVGWVVDGSEPSELRSPVKTKVVAAPQKGVPVTPPQPAKKGTSEFVHLVSCAE